MFKKHLCVCLLAALLPALAGAQSFGSSGLAGESLLNPTSLQFGPDDRLYVSQQDGDILAYTVVRDAANQYRVTDTERISLVRNITNRNDDGSVHSGSAKRQVTGIFVAGTATNPELYVSSSDYRIGGGGSGTDRNLDTNSGTISKLTKTNDGWNKVDLVRGLPRSEQNHATNGILLSGSTLYVAQGGHTNAGAPSNKFAFHTEYALSAAILAIDLGTIEALPTSTDPVTGAKYKYDLPTVDDPTRPNVNGRDVNDPFGGNDGLNQARIVPGGPVQVYAAGFRNPYDVVITQAGRMYTWDNGANGDWGGHPENEGSPNVTSNWVPGEPGSKSRGPNDAKVNNLDNLHLIGGSGYYGGHPNPIRANPAGAGLFTNNEPGGENGVFRTSVTGDNATTLPVDWPPLPTGNANPIEADFQNPGVDDSSIFTIGTSTNGLAEYTASNFNGVMSGHLLAASFEGRLYRVKLNGNGTLNSPDDVVTFAQNFGSTPLDVIAIGDNGIFPGTVWAATYGANNITIFEPDDYDNPVETCTGDDLDSVDEDGDGYSNADELDNGTDPCNGASQPTDFDGTLIGGFKVSDRNDPDDDDDGLHDRIDPFVWDATNGIGTTLPIDYPFLNGDPGFGFFGLGFTGLMINGSIDYLNLIQDEQNSNTEIIAGGAVGLFTQNGVPSGTALGSSNNQYNGFQFGLDVNAQTKPFAVEVMILGPVFSGGAAGKQSVGFYVGDGSQEDYLQFAVVTNGGSSSLEITQENAGAENIISYPASAAGLASQIRLILHLDPATGIVEASYGIGADEPILLEGTFSLSGRVLTALQSGSQALAIGLAATNFAPQTSLNATYDYLRVQEQPSPNPITESELTGPATARVDGTEILSFRNEKGNTDITIQSVDLDGPGTFSYLTFTPFPQVLKPGEQLEVEVSYTGTGDETATLTIDHDGVNGPATTVSLTTPAAPPIIEPNDVYINCGGPAVTAGGIDWQADQYSLGGRQYTNNNVSISGTTSGVLYRSERWSSSLGYAIPVANGTYEVDLHFAEIFHGNQDVNQRVFGITLEGATVLSSLDIFQEVGGYAALMKTFTITVEDGVLDVGTIKIIENPKLSAIGVRTIADCEEGTPCDDGDACTTDDAFDSNCNCTGTLADTDEDGVCDAEDICPDFDDSLIGTACDDGDACTENDTYGQDCNCAGTLIDDCGSAEKCPDFDNLPVGSACDDGDVCTTGDVLDSDCNCVGTFADSDSDGVCDNDDVCPDFDDALIGMACDDGNACTENDTYGQDCNCVGTPTASCTDILINCGGPQLVIAGETWQADQYYSGGRTFQTSQSISGTSADALYQTERYASNLAYAIPVDNGTYEITLHFADIYSGTHAINKRVFDVISEGETVLTSLDIFAEVGGYAALTKTFTVTVDDGVLNVSTVKIIENPKINAIAVRPGTSGCNEGVACDDGDECTENDIIGSDCGCAGTPIDDCEGCSNYGGLPIGSACDDGDPCTTNDVLNSDCSCAGVLADADNDGVCDAEDSCPDLDDTLIGTPCDDNDECTENDTYGQDCNCIGTPVGTGPSSTCEDLFINCGGPELEIAGNTWLSDRYFGGGRTFTTSQSVTGTTAGDIYRSERFGNKLAYSIPVENGDYTLVLHFADIYVGTQGTNLRVFGLTVEGEEVYSALDIYDEAGGFAALTKTFDVTITDGNLNIGTVQMVQNPKFSAIELRQVCETVDPCNTASLTKSRPELRDLNFEQRPEKLGKRSSQFLPDELTLFPNPTSGAFQVVFPPETEVRQLTVRDVTGRELIRYLPAGTERSVELTLPSSLTGGVYFLTAELPDGPVVKRIIKR